MIRSLNFGLYEQAKVYIGALKSRSRIKSRWRLATMAPPPILEFEGHEGLLYANGYRFNIKGVNWSAHASPAHMQPSTRDVCCASQVWVGGL